MARVVAHVHDLQRGHHVVDELAAVRQPLGPAPDLEQIARGDPVLAALVEEHHHLGRLEVLPAGAAQEAWPCTPSVTGTACGLARGRELLGGQHLLARCGSAP